jgi:hypothetical protein
VLPPSDVELRRGVLAVSVLSDLDVLPGDDGVVLTSPPAVDVLTDELLSALAGAPPEGETGRLRLTGWLLARRWAADAGPEVLAERLRPVGLPVGHPLHPGPGWVRERVLGGALHLGFGAVGLDPGDPDAVVVLPPPALAGLDADALWPAARAYLEAMGTLAADRLALDTKGILRPSGDCDVATLLGSRSLRAALAAGAGGMAVAVVPMRRRGWTRLTSVDPAFGPAAAAATAPADRGFTRPLLVTADEVALPAEGGSPADLALADPAVPSVREVLYR